MKSRDINCVEDTVLSGQNARGSLKILEHWEQNRLRNLCVGV